MKLILLKLTSFVFVSTSGVHAEATLRGSDVMVKVEASCEDGYKAGQSDVKGYWKSTGQNCDNVWELEQKANKRKKREYPSTGNWRTDSYNECARDAIDSEVKKIEKRCLENDSSQCTDLGKAAAEKVVLDNHCSPGKGQSAASYSNYKKECKKAATSICEGQIPVVANKWCPNKTLKNSKILDMQGKCKGQVNSMVPGEERVESFDEGKDLFLSELSNGIEYNEEDDIEFDGEGEENSKCKSNSDCGRQKSCRNGRCERRYNTKTTCKRNGDCNGNEFCDNNGRCIRNNSGSRCREDRDCGRDQRCKNRTCKRDTRAMKSCKKNTDCGANQRCVNGNCKRRDFEAAMEK